MADTDQEAQWRKGFEKIGPDMLWLQLVDTRIVSDTRYIRCAQAWILEKEAEKATIETKRFQKVLRWAIIASVAGVLAAIAAWVAAWPIIKAWLS